MGNLASISPFYVKHEKFAHVQHLEPAKENGVLILCGGVALSTSTAVIKCSLTSFCIKN